MLNKSIPFKPTRDTHIEKADKVVIYPSDGNDFEQNKRNHLDI